MKFYDQYYSKVKTISLYKVLPKLLKYKMLLLNTDLITCSWGYYAQKFTPYRSGNLSEYDNH